MKVGALTLFAPTHANHKPVPGRVLAAWHSPKSITWRWGFNWTPGWRGGPLGLHWWGRWGNRWEVLLRLPLLGVLSFGVQQSMFPRTYPLAGFPVRHPIKRRELIQRDETCPECGGDLDTGNECNVCHFDAMLELKGLRACPAEDVER